MPDELSVYYAVTVFGHDGIPDGEWSYVFFFPVNPFGSDCPPDYSTHPRVEVVCRSYERLVGKGVVEKHLFPFVTLREKRQYVEAYCEGISFTCPEADARFPIQHQLSSLQYSVDLVLRVQEQDSTETGFPPERDGQPKFFSLIPFQRKL